MGSPAVTDDPMPPPSPAPLARAVDADAPLVARAQEHDRAAFAVLVERHQALAFRICYRILGDPEDAADAAQEAFLRAYRRLDTFRGQSSFRTWFTRLTVNVALNERTGRRDHTTLDDNLPALDAPPNGDHTAGLIQAETVAQVQLALQLVPPNHRAAVVLRDLEGYSYAETAAALGVPEGTAKGWAHRGRERLKDLLT